jgi:hypothetical protein
MGKSPKAPTPLDPDGVAGKQAGWNTKNAQETAGFNRLNQKDAFGNTIEYSQDGVDENGNPKFSVSQGMGGIGKQFSEGFEGLGKKYFDMAGQPVESSMDAMNRAYDAATAFSAPRQQRQTASMDTKLLNSGLDPSSEAYRNRMRDLTENQSMSNNTLAAQLQGQMFNQGMQGRQQQLSELSPGLQFGMGAMNPNFTNVPQVNVGNVDYSGLANAAKGQEWQGYNAKMANKNAMIGGLAGIGGTFLGMPMAGGGSVGGSIFGKMFT